MNLIPISASALSTPIGLVIVPVGVIAAWLGRIFIRHLNAWLSRHDEIRAHERWVREFQAARLASRSRAIATTHDAAACNDVAP